MSVHYPIQQGSYTIEQTVALPKEVPKGGSTPLFVSELHWQNPCLCFLAKFIVDVQGYTDDDDDMFCLKLKVDFMKKPF